MSRHPEENGMPVSNSANTLRWTLAVFVAALAVRMGYLLQYSSSPAFGFPIIDSATYNEIARGISSGGGLDPRLFWQGFLYPVILSAIFSLSGQSMMAALAAQAVTGAITCVMVLVAGRRFFDEKTARAAAIVTALYGPLVFFEARLLATGLAAFWMVTLLYMLDRCATGRQAWICVSTGVVSALAVLTRPTFFPVVLGGVAWVALSSTKVKASLAGKSMPALAIASGLAAILLSVSVLSYEATGHFSPVPRSGSLNLYIGNNRQADRTMMIRPGSGWRELIREPEMHGYSGDSGHREYFMRRFREYVASDPVGFARGLVAKTLHLLSSRELPRNLDIYSWREDSGLLEALVWRAGPFGFPFGILLPFTLAGAFFGLRKRPGLFGVILIGYSSSLVLVFVSSRYRTPMVPVMSLLAVEGVRHTYRTLRWGTPKGKVMTAALIVSAVLVSTVPGPFALERYDYRAEKHSSLGYEMGKAGHLDEAEVQLRTAVELQPGYAAPRRMLGNVLVQMGRPDEAIEHFEKSLGSAPDHYMTHFYLALALSRTGEYDKALAHLEEARRGAVASRDAYSMRQIEDLERILNRERDEEREKP